MGRPARKGERFRGKGRSGIAVTLNALALALGTQKATYNNCVFSTFKNIIDNTKFVKY